MGRCKDCKHWGTVWGTNITGDCQKAEWQDRTDIAETPFNIVAYSDDDQGLNAYVLTKPDFGCVLFEEK